jgi:hypothetical protein
MVHKHFSSNNINIPIEEEKEYTASIFIASLPPVCDVYIDSIFMGKSNYELYFKPGTINITLKKKNLSLNVTLIVNEGINQSKFIKLK